MKKIGIVLLIMLVLPVFVNAGSFSGETGRANGYLQRDTFSNSYKKYLLYNNLKFGFANGKPINNSSFTLGGFISEEEYKLTIPKKGSSYLLTGDPYWTLTPDGSKYKVIEYSGSNTNELNSYESDNTRPKARVTEYVNPNTSVSGTGRQNDPWIFDPMFRVNFKIPGSHATIEGSSEQLDGYERGATLSNIYLKAKCKGTECTKTIKLIIEDGYNYISDTCDGSFNYDTNEYTVNNLTKDVECKLTIGIGKFHVNLVKGDWEETRDPSPNNVYLRQRENYYRENEYKNIIYKLDTNPERYGYTFKGYSIIDTTIKIIDETGKFIDKTSIKKNNENIISDWQQNKYTLTFNPNGGTINASETRKEVTFDELYGTLPLATRAGYSFKGWFTTATNNEQIKETDIVKYAGNRTLYAQWTICSVGTYNTGNKTTCTACPTGYTSAQGSTAESQCYMNVPGGKYLTVRASSALPCEKGTSRNGEVTRYYGESVSCADCTAGTYQDSTGQTSCKNCPNGYTSGIKATAENQCFITVPTGNKLVAKASSPAQCEAGTYRNGAVVKNYGDSLSCSNCVAGTYSGAGASSCTNCAAGTYSGAKASACTNCAAGTYSGTKASACTNCAAGTYSGAKASSCTNCAAGTYSGAKASSCTNCPAGTYSGAKASSCTNCVAGTYSGAKASFCTNCPSDQWSNDRASSCFSRCNSVTYKVTSTCSKTCGGGTLKREAYSAYVSSYRCSAKDDWNGGSCNTQSCIMSPYVSYKCANASNCSSGCTLNYTGNCAMTGNSTNWRVLFYTSGTLTFSGPPGNIDLFLVGGGGGGAKGEGNFHGCGGGGGYTASYGNIGVSVNTNYGITIGYGGGPGAAGGSSSAFGRSAGGGGGGYTINQGGVGHGGHGGSGGGGGGDFGGAGGSDGGAGGAGTVGWYTQAGGNGQGSSTREFWELDHNSSASLYAGGGGAGAWDTAGNGGAGGGAPGHSSYEAWYNHGPGNSAAANTGGGGGGGYTAGSNGGSGIVVIRNHR